MKLLPKFSLPDRLETLYVIPPFQHNTNPFSASQARPLGGRAIVPSQRTCFACTSSELQPWASPAKGVAELGKVSAGDLGELWPPVRLADADSI